MQRYVNFETSSQKLLQAGNVAAYASLAERCHKLLSLTQEFLVERLWPALCGKPDNCQVSDQQSS